MYYGLTHLAYLVSTKNEMNRKRRRFLYLTNMYKGIRSHKSFPKKYCKHMYEQTKKDMKAMTPAIRAARKELNATLVWGSGGQVTDMWVGEFRHNAKSIARLAELHLVDEILLK